MVKSKSTSKRRSISSYLQKLKWYPERRRIEKLQTKSRERNISNSPFYASPQSVHQYISPEVIPPSRMFGPPPPKSPIRSRNLPKRK